MSDEDNVLFTPIFVLLYISFGHGEHVGGGGVH